MSYRVRLVKCWSGCCHDSASDRGRVRTENRSFNWRNYEGCFRTYRREFGGHRALSSDDRLRGAQDDDVEVRLRYGRKCWQGRSPTHPEKIKNGMGAGPPALNSRQTLKNAHEVCNFPGIPEPFI